jgi:hypothetical protein
MKPLTKDMVILTFGLLTIQTAPSVHAQGRMGMMMGRQMMMNSGLMGMNGMAFNPHLARDWNWYRYGNPYDRQWYVTTGYGGYFGDYAGTDGSNSKSRKSKYRRVELTLSLEEERQRRHQMELAWSQGDLSESGSQTATALNILLDDLRVLQSKGIQAPDMVLETESLGRLNVLVGRTTGNAGLLKNNGRLEWPRILQGPDFQSERELISCLAPQVIEQARHGQVTDLSRFASAVDKMHQNLRVKIAEIPTPAYIRANRFLTQIDEAIKILRLPDASNYFNHTYAAQGSTAGELVRHMTLLDLHFAPPVEGDASAYRALHQVLAAYDRAAHEQMVARK